MKILSWLVVGLVLGIGGYAIYHKLIATDLDVIDYAAVLRNSRVANDASAVMQQHNLTAMLEAGIKTNLGILKSQQALRKGRATQYVLTLNGEATQVKTVSPIELVKGFLVAGQQIMLIAYDQGGNQCSRQYRVISLDKQLGISNPFGTCLPIIQAEQDGDAIIMVMPKNNPYLGQGVTLKYKYQAGRLIQMAPARPLAAATEVAGLTATKILNIAAHDGCYQDGVLLDDNACGNGLKYCSMFKNIAKQSHDPDYQLLAEFCAPPPQ